MKLSLNFFSFKKLSVWLSVVCLAVFVFSSCSGNQVSEKAKRQSIRYYQSGHVAWSVENDNLTAIRALNRAIDTDPENDNAYYLLGTIRLVRGEYDIAEKHLKKAVSLREGGIAAKLCEAQNSLGVLYIHKEKYTNAVELLKASSGEVLNKEPWLALGNLGWAYIELGENDKAIDVLKRALFEQPKFCVGMFRIAKAYYNKKDYKTAEAFLKRSFDIPETNCGKMQETHYLLAMTYLRLDRMEEARKEFSICVEISDISPVGIKCRDAI